MIRIDASVPIGSDTPVWQGDPQVETSLLSSIAKGAANDVTLLKMTTHAGTHVDAPKHFIVGAKGVDEMDLDVLIGPAFVLDLPEVTDLIEAAHVKLAPQCERLIFRTANTTRKLMRRKEFCTGYASIGETAAKELVSRGVRLAGIDYLSVESFNGSSHVVHDTLLKAGVIPLEGLDLTDVEGGWWTLICLPAKLQGADGSPARVIFERR